MSCNCNKQVCDICERTFEQGSHQSNGHKLRRYGGIMVCEGCWQVNRDGWAPPYEEILIAHLFRQGLPVPTRNDNGRLPRD